MWNKLRKTDQFILIFFVIIAGLRNILVFFPAIITTYYSNLFYPKIHKLQFLLFNWVPFPVSYLLILLFLGYTFYLHFKIIRKNKFRAILISLSIFWIRNLMIIYCLFQVFWGFNYARLDISEELNLDKTEITIEYLTHEIKNVENKLLQIRSTIDTNLLYQKLNQKQILEIQNEMVISFHSNALKPFQISKCNILFPKGILLHWATSGIYFPFTGECNIDGGLHPIQEPFTIAHELCHGAGWGDEATCNFLAWVALKDSENLFFQYSVWFGYWKELQYNLKLNFKEAYKSYIQTIDNHLLTDSRLVRNEMAKYKDYFPELQKKVFDQFLKTQGVGEGIKSYNKMIDLVMAYQKSKMN